MEGNFTSGGSYYLDLLDFNGLLGALLPQGEGTEKSFDLWVMNGSWTKQFTIDFVPGVERALGFWKNGEFFLESSDHELVLFDPSTRELKNLAGNYDKRGITKRGELSIFPKSFIVLSHCLHMMPRQKAGPDASVKKTDAWIPGSTRSPKTYILKDRVLLAIGYVEIQLASCHKPC
ncbi:hypothetical protein V6N12_047678 [Hibiscus sabdariffa]|uniref:F-box associated domain-containing protein n=1 Tax=Hibiscus sabdariffa TaxID=183260 RepID=A0ABR2CTP0_9ROSI